MTANTARLGFYSAIVACMATVGYGVVQILQLVKWLVYPWDEILIYVFSLSIAIPFMLALLALHYTVPSEKKIWSHAALLLAVMYAVYATLVYVVQLTVAIPKSLQGQGETIQVLLMREHSFFWTLDALAYLCMGVATLFAAFGLVNRGIQRWLKGFLLANALLTPVVALVYFYPHFSIPLLLLASPWLVTAPGAMLLLALFFREQLRKLVREVSLSTYGLG